MYTAVWLCESNFGWTHNPFLFWVSIQFLLYTLWEMRFEIYSDWTCRCEVLSNNLFLMDVGLLAKMSEHEAFRPVATIRIVIIVAMISILIVGIVTSFLLAKVWSFLVPLLPLANRNLSQWWSSGCFVKCYADGPWHIVISTLKLIFQASLGFHCFSGVIGSSVWRGWFSIFVLHNHRIKFPALPIFCFSLFLLWESSL